MITFNTKRIVKWLKYAVVLLFLSNNSLAQYQAIQFDNQTPEMTAIDEYEDVFFMAGSVSFIEELKSYPALAAVNLSGDTLLTKIYKNYSFGGDFSELIVHDDTLYTIGYFKQSEYSGQWGLSKYTNKGELISFIYLPDGYYENSFTYYENMFFVSFKSKETKENMLARLSKDLKLDSSIYYDHIEFPIIESITALNNQNLNAVVIEGKDKKNHLLFQVQNFDEHLERQDSVLIEPAIKGYNSKLIVTDANQYWFVSRERSNDSYYFSVMSFDSTGKKRFNYQEPTEKGTTICSMKETSTGDVIILVKREDTSFLMVFRDNKFYRSIELEEISHSLPVEILEISPEKFKIFGLGLSQIGSVAAYGKTFMYDVKY